MKESLMTYDVWPLYKHIEHRWILCCFMFVMIRGFENVERDRFENDSIVWNMVNKWSVFNCYMRRQEEKNRTFCICHLQGRMFSEHFNWIKKRKKKTSQTASTDLTDANHNRNFPKIKQNKTKLNPVNVLRFKFWFIRFYAVLIAIVVIHISTFRYIKPFQ